jgi:K+-sensing histidine kinase KdpD
MSKKKEIKRMLKAKKKQKEQQKASSEWYIAGFITFVLFAVAVITLELSETEPSKYYGVLFLLAILGLGTWKWANNKTIIGGILRGMTIFSVWVLIEGASKLIYKIVFE